MFRCTGIDEFAGCGCCGPRPGFLFGGIDAAASSSLPSPTNIEAMQDAGRPRASSTSGSFVIDCHGHYTTEPPEFLDWRKRQIAAIGDASQAPSIDSFQVSDDRLRQSVEGAQLRLQRERGTSLTLFSPRASGMSHHIGDAGVSAAWSRLSNDLIHRMTRLYPANFVGVCQLPQSPGVEPKNCIDELARCVNELGFVGCNLNPDPSGGYWTDPPLTDRWWYPLYEKMVELDVPAMVHVSAAANPAFHTTGSHYINGDTTAFMQFLVSDLFKDFPTLRFVIPHGGGAVPYHWGRYRGLAQDLKRPPLSELLLKNVFFDTCVYHQPGIDLLTRVIPAENILFASEMVGAVKGIDPESGFNYDDTRRYIDASTNLTPDQKRAIFAGNVQRVYPRLPAKLSK
jgi:4-oxalmesaconate hydratase